MNERRSTKVTVTIAEEGCTKGNQIVVEGQSQVQPELKIPVVTQPSLIKNGSYPYKSMDDFKGMA